MKKSALVTLLLGAVAIASEAADKISSYRPYPYVFLHGRWSDGGQWGMNCSQGAELATTEKTVHDPEPDGSFADVSTCRVFDKFWGRRGYAESFYNEFFRPHECD